MELNSRHARFQDALAWAQQHLDIETSEIVRDMPWGMTAVLRSNGQQHFLKVLPEKSSAAIEISKSVSEIVPDFAPAVLAGDGPAGRMIIHDHHGLPSTSMSSMELKLAALKRLAELQTVALGAGEKLASLPALRWETLWAHTMQFVVGDANNAGNGSTLASYIGYRRAAQTRELLQICEQTLSDLAKAAFRLPVTLNHGDFHTNNMAVRQDGQVVFHDWDNAVCGPAGLSLNSMIGSVAGALRHLMPMKGGNRDANDETAIYVEAYVAALVEGGYASETRLRRGLPGSILAGLLYNLVAYAELGEISRTDLSVCVADVERICKEITQSCMVLSMTDRGASVRMLEHLAQNAGFEVTLNHVWEMSGAIEGGVDQISQLEAELPKTGIARTYLPVATSIIRDFENSRKHDVPPQLHLTLADHGEPEVLASKIGVATSMFAEHGCLFVHDAFPAPLLEECRRAFEKGEFHSVGQPLKVGDCRYMTTVPVDGPFNNRDLFAADFINGVMQRMLGPDYILGSFTIVSSEPGAQLQHLHVDHAALFPEVSGQPDIPPFAITVLVPLVDIDTEIGGTAVAKGSHRVDPVRGRDMPLATSTLSLGGCLFMDYRLYHRGLANKAKRARPVLSMVYHRAWFRDSSNFHSQPPLQIAGPALEAMDPELQKRFVGAYVY